MPLGLDHHLDRLPIGHRPVATGHAVEVHDSIEDAAGLNRPIEDVRQELVDVSANRRGTARDREVAEEGRLPAGHGFVLRHTYATDCPTGASHSDRRLCRLLEPDAFQYGMRPVAAGELANPLDRFLTALADHVGGAEIARERNPVLVAAEDDDLLGAQPLGRDHAAETYRTVTDNGDALARAHPGGDGGVVTGAHHVSERPQRG